MSRIPQVETEEDYSHVRVLFGEYLQWVNARLDEELGISFDVESKIQQDMDELGMFSPPHGRLLLAYEGSDIAGIACMRRIKEDIGEIKRMYVRPSFRRRGIGRGLLKNLLHEARSIGYSRIRLDSA